MKKLSKKSLFLIIPVIIIVLLLPYITEFLDISLFKSSQTVEITVPPGSSVRDIADILKENDLIKSKNIFILKYKLGKSKELNYGTFDLDKKMSISKIIKTLAESSAKRDTVSVTFPEGSSVQQMALIVEESGIATSKDFINALSDSYNYEFIKHIPDGEYDHKLQGFLFPETYEFFKDATAHDVIDRMLLEFEKRYSSVSDNYENMFEIMTKASIIEKEAKLDSERPTVAGVINNRLDIDMKLEIDACVVYAVTEGLYDLDVVLYSHLRSESPYNTYKFYGLTPGPICCPGITSIEAAINPESHDYLYYHTDEKKKDGSHIFTKDMESHLATMN